MPSLLSDLLQFIQAVFLRWSNLVTGGLVALAWLCYEKFSDRQIPMKVFIWILSIGLFVSLFGAWREQYLKNKIGLRPSIELTLHAENAQGAVVLVLLRITNTGPPTVIENLSADIKFGGGKELKNVWAWMVKEDNFFPVGNKTAVLKREHMIYDKVASPIPTGGIVQGFAQYRLLGTAGSELREKGFQITVHLEDAFGRKCDAVSAVPSTSGGSTSNVPPMTFPGMENPFEILMTNPGPASSTQPSSTPDKGASPP